MSGVTYDYQRIYEELKSKIETAEIVTDNINLIKLYQFMKELEQKYKINYDNDDLPF